MNDQNVKIFKKKSFLQYIYRPKNLVYVHTLLVICCLYPVNVKTTELIITYRTKFFCGTSHVCPQGRFTKHQNFKTSTKFECHQFLKNPRFIFIESTNILFCFCFTMYTKRKCSQLKQKMGAKRPKSLAISLSEWYIQYTRRIMQGVPINMENKT